MRKEFAVLSVSFALLVACGDETTIENVTRAGMDVVASADDLPECTEENEGEYAFVKADEETRICVDGKWKPAALSDAENGSFSCKTEELKDKSGLKIVCNGDSIGVVLNGADGKPGENGNDGAPGTSCSITARSDTAVVIACGDSTITIDLKVNQPQDTAKVDSEQVSIFRDSLVGYAQKGPFLKGSTVYLYDFLDGIALSQVSGPLMSTVIRDDGYFKFPAHKFASQYALVVVDGNYRNEITDKVSESPIRLKALVDLSNRDSVNVNVLTHLEYERVYHLVTRENYTVEKAKQKALQEILKRFHIELDGVTSAENLNIFGSTDADAALLAVSILLQGDSSSLGLSTLLNEISNDISETGKWTGTRADFVLAGFADWAISADFRQWLSSFDGWLGLSNRFIVIRQSFLKWGLDKTLPDFEKYIRRFFSVESGLGVCGSDSVSVGVVKHVSNRFVRTYYASDYSDVSNTIIRFICKENDGFKNWQMANDIEKDTMSFGHEYVEGNVRNGRVNSSWTYVYENGNWRLGTELDSLIRTGCLTGRQDTVANVPNTSSWYICKSNTWQVATDIERDTATWGHNHNEGDVRNGNVNTTLTYVYQDGNWRLGTELDSLLVKAGGTACITDGDTSTVKYNDVYYVCTPQTSGDVVRMWVVASDIYNDTYEARDECKKGKDGVYGDGTMLNGRVNTGKVYVCDNREFRQAEPIEINGGKGCTTYNRDEYYVLNKDLNGNKQYSFYKCTVDGWEFTLEKLNKDEITDSRDGKKYKTIGIKTQMWMAENLNFDYKVKPIDSDSVVYGSYTNSNCDTCGHYYTWAAAMDSAGVFSNSALGCGYGNECSVTYPVRGICPEGWHLPSNAEWETLINVAGGRDVAGTMLKSQYDWNNDGNGLDTYGFSALPAALNFGDDFASIGDATFFWSAVMAPSLNDPDAKAAHVFNLQYYSDIADVLRTYRLYGLSVRCLKD